MGKTQSTRRVAQDHVRLARNLRQLRHRAGLGGIEAGRRAGISQAKISRIENCRFLPSIDDVHRLCAVYNATSDEREELTRLAVAVREASKRSRVVLPRGAAQLQATFAEMEQKASVRRTFCPTVVPGLLQTAAYVRIMFQGEVPDEDLDQVVTARVSRRHAYRDSSKQAVIVMTEGALRWQLGSPAVMVEQIEAIVDATRMTNLRVGIIPWTTPAQVVCSHSFDMYDSAAVVVGTEVSSATFTEPDDVNLYLDVFGRLEGLAVFGEDARRELTRIAGDYRLLA